MRQEHVDAFMIIGLVFIVNFSFMSLCLAFIVEEFRKFNNRSKDDS